MSLGLQEELIHFTDRQTLGQVVEGTVLGPTVMTMALGFAAGGKAASFEPLKGLRKGVSEMILIAGQELHAAMQAEKAAIVEQSVLGFNSEQLCALQRKQAGRGIVGACIVKSMYGFSVRYDSGLQDFGIIKSARGSSDPSLEAAIEFCKAWVAQAPASRYAWHREDFF